MKLTKAILSTAALLAIADAPGQAQAQPSLADQKLQADIDKTKLDIEAARLKMQLDQQAALTTALSAVRGTTGGQATIDKPEATAEGLLLSRRLYTGAAGQLADATVGLPKGSTPIVMFGTAAPSTADWLAFDNLVSRLEPKLRTAIDDWKRVNEKTAAPAGPRGRSIIGAAALGTVGVVANAVTSVASLFRVDTSVGGVPISATDQEVRSLLAKALADKGFKVDGTGLEIAGVPEHVKARLAAIEVGSSRVDLQACKLEYSIVSPK